MTDEEKYAQEMDDRTIRYLVDIMIDLGMHKNFIIGTLNGMKTPVHRAAFLEFFWQSHEHNLEPTKEQIRKAAELIKDMVENQEE